MIKKCFPEFCEPSQGVMEDGGTGQGVSHGSPGFVAKSDKSVSILGTHLQFASEGEAVFWY